MEAVSFMLKKLSNFGSHVWCFHVWCFHVWCGNFISLKPCPLDSRGTLSILESCTLFVIEVYMQSVIEIQWYPEYGMLMQHYVGYSKTDTSMVHHWVLISPKKSPER